MSDSNAIHRLLCFAHRGEAKAFLQELSFRPWKVKENLYQCPEKNLTLVLTGEGGESTLIKLTQAIVTLKENFPGNPLEVLNLGVCGALKDSPFQFNINDVVEVTTAYGQDEFKSFSSPISKEESPFPCASVISSKERILEPSSAKALSYLAPLVDREGWAVGRVCQELKVPFRMLKVVSDFADGEICARVKEDTEVWSDLLLRAFLKVEPDFLSTISNKADLKEKLPELHVTLSQERKLTQLLKALEIKGYALSAALEAVNYNELVAREIRPKEKTKELTLLLLELLNPLEKTLKTRLEKNTAPLKEAGFQVSFDQGYEQERVQLHINIESEAQINKMIAALESYDFMELRNILRGQERV